MTDIEQSDPIKRRRVARIGRELLPDSLKALKMVFDTGDIYPVETFDASTLGLGLIVPLPESVVRQNLGVMLQANDLSFRLIGEVVFIIAQGPDTCRVGVQFTQTIAIEGYLDILPMDQIVPE